MAMQSQTQRSLLFAFIGSITLCGGIGIYCLLIGRLSSLAGRVLGTTAAVGAASILGLAAAVAWERRRWHPIGPAGMGAVGWALVLLLGLIWIDRSYESEGLVKTAVIVSVIAVALPHVGLLALARLRREYEWVRRGTLVAIAANALLVSALVLLEWDDEGAFRLMGAIAIACVCGSIAVPILHRVSAIHAHESIRTTKLQVALTCPRCGKPQTLDVGHSRCASCGLRFRLEIEEEHCPACGYVLFGIESAACPECGAAIART